MLRPDRLPLVVVAACVAGALVLVTEDARAAPPRTNNWNQWDDDASNGVSQGLTKLSLAFDYARAGDDHALRLGGEFEHLLRDRWGLVGSFALPVAGTWVAPGTLGLRFHLLPKTPVDPFLGLSGGFAWLRPDGVAAELVPMVAARGGLALYVSGLFFVQAEGGYDFVRYSANGVAFDLGGAVITGRLGVYF